MVVRKPDTIQEPRVASGVGEETWAWLDQLTLGWISVMFRAMVLIQVTPFDPLPK